MLELAEAAATAVRGAVLFQATWLVEEKERVAAARETNDRFILNVLPWIGGEAKLQSKQETGRSEQLGYMIERTILRRVPLTVL